MLVLPFINGLTLGKGFCRLNINMFLFAEQDHSLAFVVRLLVSKKPEMIYEYVFVLNLGVGYGAASVCPQQLSMICLMLWQGHDFCQLK